jgi:acyl dehydratase
MKFAELTAGLHISCGTRRVLESEILDFARQYDPQWFHIDSHRAHAGRWRGLISSGWMTCSIAMEMVCRTILNGSEGMGSPGVESLSWPAPVRPNDILSLTVVVLHSRISKSGKYGVLQWQWLLDNQDGKRVLDLITTCLFDLQADTP